MPWNGHISCLSCSLVTGERLCGSVQSRSSWVWVLLLPWLSSLHDTRFSPALLVLRWHLQGLQGFPQYCCSTLSFKLSPWDCQSVSAHTLPLPTVNSCSLSLSSCSVGDGEWGIIICCPASISVLGRSFLPVSLSLRVGAFFVLLLCHSVRTWRLWSEHSDSHPRDPPHELDSPPPHFCSLSSESSSVSEGNGVCSPSPVASGLCSIRGQTWWWEPASCLLQRPWLLSPDLRHEGGFVWFSSLPQKFLWGLF